MSGVAAWGPPPDLALGQLANLDLRLPPGAAGPLPRPGDDRLGPLAVRAVEPLPDGAGWRLTVQPLAPGAYRIPALDLGAGWATGELAVTVPRTVAYGAPWMGLGGGGLDRLPPVPFPRAWTLPLALPLALLGLALARWRRRGARDRRRRAARRAFARRWPPAAGTRAALDAAHGTGRALLAAYFGTEALSWGPAACGARGLEPWADWIRALDTARFAGHPGPGAPAGPPLAELLGCLAPERR
jgi:hypothetical protein